MPAEKRIAGRFVIVVFCLAVACTRDPSHASSTPKQVALAALGDLARRARDTRLASVLVAHRYNSTNARMKASIPATADGAFEIGPRRSPAFHLRVTADDVTAAPAAPGDGPLVYSDAYPHADLVTTTTDAALEELVLLRDEQAPRHYSWHVALGNDVAQAKMRANGSLGFTDRRGKTVLEVPAPYAMDARGTKRDALLAWDADTQRMTLDLDTSGLIFPVLLDPAFDVAVWDQVQVPPARQFAQMAFDAARGRVVLFGGYGVATDTTVAAKLNDTWTWDGETWNEEAPVTSPPARESAAMVYDALHAHVVLYGGAGAGGDLADTWTWDGTTWSLAPTTTAPSARAAPAMTYDGARQQIVLFGGSNAGGTAGDLGDTWTWDGASPAWIKTSPAASPSARAAGALAYDAARGRVVLFGGGNSDETPTLTDTWTWDGATWTEEAPALFPSARDNAAMVYDAASARTLLFGGSTSASHVLADTWSWDGAAWTKLAPATSPPARASATLAYDAVRQRVVLFGGGGASGRLADNWTWDGTTWTASAITSAPPSARYASTLAFDEANGTMLLFGGGTDTDSFNDTWTWSGSVWTQLAPATSPPGAGNPLMVYDAALREMVLVNGPETGTQTLSDIWTWNGTTWTETHPATAPPVRVAPGLAYDALHQQVVLFGGGNLENTAYLADTWTFDGTTWTEHSPATSPLARQTAVMTYDAARQVVVLFGGFNDVASPPTTVLNDTWTWDGTTWTQAMPATPPPPRSSASMTFDTTRGQAVLFGGYGVSDFENLLNDVWTWDGSEWTEATSATSPPPRSAQAMGYDEAHERVVLFGGYGQTGSFFDDTWLYYERGNECTSATGCATGFCVDGACCEVPSCGSCQTCAGASPGTCTAVEGAADPDTCTGAQSCDQDGVCRQANGQMCSDATACASGFCVDGVCCDSACDGLCQSCSAVSNVTGAGICGDVKSGLDPRHICPTDAVRSCSRDGTCDGKGACRIYAPGTSCGPSACDDNRAGGLVCDGLGACSDSARGVDCTPYVCDIGAGSCVVSCKSDDECTEGNACVANKCVARQDGVAFCDGDHTVTSSSGGSTDCSPYKCAGTTCRSSCNSIADCSDGTVCDPAQQCVTASAVSSASGCGVGPTRGTSGSSRAALVFGVALAVLLGRRAARRRLRTFAHLPQNTSGARADEIATGAGS